MTVYQGLVLVPAVAPVVVPAGVVLVARLLGVAWPAAMVIGCLAIPVVWFVVQSFPGPSEVAAGEP